MVVANVGGFLDGMASVSARCNKRACRLPGVKLFPMEGFYDVYHCGLGGWWGEGRSQRRRQMWIRRWHEFLAEMVMLRGNAGVRRAGGQDLDDRGFGQAAVKVLRARRESRRKTADDKGMSGLELVETRGPFCPTGTGDPEHSHVPA